jgi:hypothetical protein
VSLPVGEDSGLALAATRELDAEAEEAQASLTPDPVAIACSSLDPTLPEPVEEFRGLLVLPMNVRPDRVEIRL